MTRRTRQLGLAALVGAGVLLLAVVVWGGLTWWLDAPPRLVRVDVVPHGSVHIGEPVRYRVVIACPVTSFPLSPFEIKLAEGLQALNEQRRPGAVGLTGVRWVCELTVQPFDLGTIGKSALTAKLSSGRRSAGATITAELPGLEVKPLLKNDEQNLRLAKPIPGSPWRPSLRWWQWLLALAVAGAIGWAIWRWWLRPVVHAGPPPEPCWEKARRAMQRLEDSLPQPAEAFFVRLTDILRGYCEERFGVRATEATTPEFLALIRRDPTLSADQRRSLEDFLRAADEVKFAKGDATEEQLRAALRTARQFVTETVPPPPAGAK